MAPCKGGAVGDRKNNEFDPKPFGQDGADFGPRAARSQCAG